MSRPEYGSDLHLWNQEDHPADFRPETICLLCGGEDELHTVTCSAGYLARPVARSTDPGTSWEAARSITPEKLRQSQELVLRALQVWGPMNDEQLIEWLASRHRVTPSGVRSRRSELVSMGLVRDSGRKDVLRSGRRAIVWEAV